MLMHCCCQNFFLCLLLFTLLVSAKHHGNPATELVNLIEVNRTAQKLTKLSDNPGLGCIALQYIDECTGNCSTSGVVSCQFSEEAMTEIYAPDCGVELPTVAVISGHLIGCSAKPLKPVEAFSEVLVRDKRALSLIHSKEHTEVGTAVRKANRRFFWCMLFSGGQANSTFVLEAGTGIRQKRGCYSGTDEPCSRGQKVVYCPLAVFFSVLVFLASSIFSSL